jgi:site-specific recombinase XerD
MFQTYIKSRSFRRAAARLPQSELAEFIQYFLDHGYAHKTIHCYLCAVIHFADWMTRRGISCSDATAQDKNEFIQQRMIVPSSSGLFMHNRNSYAAALSHWLRYLDNDVEILPTNNKVVEEFDRYLHEVAGLASSTRIYRCRNTREFLNWLASSGSTQINAIQLTDLSAFVRLRATQVSLVTTAGIACSLNSFIRFLSARGYCEFAAGTRVLRPKLLHRTPSNKSLTTAELSSLLDCIDRAKPSGKRDYAITRCLIDLGLRTSEVANIYLSDIDWRASQLTLNIGKTRRQLVFPMCEPLLGAFMDYVLHARPVTAAKHLFVHHRAPLGRSIEATTVRQVVRRVFLKAGFTSEQSQVHRLRHAMATRLLTNQVPLKTIADVLGHQSINTTLRYTYVDKTSLAAIAMPWPNVSGDKV